MKKITILLFLLISCGCSDPSNPWPDYNIKEYSPESLAISVNRIETTSEGKSVLFINVKNVGTQPINTYSINLTFHPVKEGFAHRSWAISMGPTIFPQEEIIKKTIEDTLLTDESFELEVTGAGMVTPKYENLTKLFNLMARSIAVGERSSGDTILNLAELSMVSPELVVNTLGMPIRKGFFQGGNVSINADFSKTASIDIPVHGSKNSGVIVGQANTERKNSEWFFLNYMLNSMTNNV